MNIETAYFYVLSAMAKKKIDLLQKFPFSLYRKTA